MRVNERGRGGGGGGLCWEKHGSRLRHTERCEVTLRNKKKRGGGGS